MSIASAQVPKGAADDLRIGEWRLAARGNELRRGEEVVRLEPKAAELLAYLAGRPGEVVGREDLLRAVWPGVVVGDDALTQVVIKLRKALGDDAHSPQYIETISKRGYRLIAPVPAPPGAAPEATREAKARRNRTAIGVAAALAVVVLGGILVVGIPGMPWPVGTTSGQGPPAAAIPTVAVLPLANLSGDARRDYFSDGITEDLINGLGRFTGVRVMSRRAVEAYKGKAVAPGVIQRELGARYLVQGSVREADGRVRVAVELSDAQSGAALASETHDGQGAQLFEIQDLIVRNIVGRLQVKLTQIEQQRALARPTESLEAYDLVLRARALLNRNDRGANREARVLLARAQQLAPDYADIGVAMGMADFQRASEGWIEDAAVATRRAEGLAKQALSLPDSRAHARAHSLLANIYSHQERYEEALAHAQSAVDLNPSDAVALWWRGSAAMCMGRIDEAIGFLETARRFEPRPSAGQGLNLAMAYYVAGRYTEALLQADAMLALSPSHGVSHAMRAAALARLGRSEDALLAAAEVRRVDPLFDPENFGGRFADKAYTAQLREGLRMAGL